jgi:hypothetical protein
MKVIFKQLPRYVFGMCDFTDIWIDLRKGANPAYTFIHELCHLYHPDWSETKVIKESRKIWKKMSQRQRFELYKKLFNRKWVQDE